MLKVAEIYIAYIHDCDIDISQLLWLHIVISAVQC